MLKQEINLCVLGYSYTRRRTKLNFPTHLSVQSHTQSSVCFTEYSALAVYGILLSVRSFLSLLPLILMHMLEFLRAVQLWSNSKYNMWSRIFHSSLGSSDNRPVSRILAAQLKLPRLEGLALNLFPGFSPCLKYKITFILKKISAYIFCCLSDIIGLHVRKCQGLWHLHLAM